ncbi:hypothetical protein BCR39DRAFT_512900 [Naematelia encephala]|uniref:Uncharacterized protein n=1 Tax=Naematelia encephala TaxID=71784 RepID=A0A1Y2BMS6_9TREE|nr:hypothetical protein BCR39DRAFT_512900 [Naematelia encephala]
MVASPVPPIYGSVPNNQQMMSSPVLPVYGLAHGHISRPVSEPQPNMSPMYQAPAPPNMLGRRNSAQPPMSQSQHSDRSNPNPTNGHLRDFPPHMQPNEPVEHFRNIAVQYRQQQMQDQQAAEAQAQWQAWVGQPQNQQPQ